MTANNEENINIATKQNKDGVFEVSITGPLTFASSETFRAEVTDKVLQSNTKHVKVDLSKTDYLDSTILGVLLALHIRLKNRGIRMTIVLNSIVEKVIRGCNLDKVLTVEKK